VGLGVGGEVPPIGTGVDEYCSSIALDESMLAVRFLKLTRSFCLSAGLGEPFSEISLFWIFAIAGLANVFGTVISSLSLLKTSSDSSDKDSGASLGT
jgi:hypothetical protein